MRSVIAIIVVALLAGCASAPADPNAAPAELEIQLYSHSTDGKYIYMTLARDRTIAFAGGVDAYHRTERPVGQITPEQRQKLWAIIAQYHLLDASGPWFDSGQKVTYTVDIKAGDWSSNSFRALDEQTPGVKELHDAMYQMQKEMRYKGGDL